MTEVTLHHEEDLELYLKHAKIAAMKLKIEEQKENRDKEIYTEICKELDYWRDAIGTLFLVKLYDECGMYK